MLVGGFPELIATPRDRLDTDGAVRHAALQRGVAALDNPDEVGVLLENLVAATLRALSLRSGVRLFRWRRQTTPTGARSQAAGPGQWSPGVSEFIPAGRWRPGDRAGLRSDS
jgi:hypothetical protein